MHIKQLKLVNFRRFGDLTIPFYHEESQENANTVVFISDNGGGKTAILDALAISLSWLIARINRERGSGRSISDMDISNGQVASSIELQLEHNQLPYRWFLAKILKGKATSKVSDFSSQLTKISQLAMVFIERLVAEEDNASLPLIAYYPCERIVLDNVPLKSSTKFNYGQLTGYENSLKQRTDFRYFFEWFKDREDAENEFRAALSEQVFFEMFEKHKKGIPDIEKAFAQSSIASRDPQLTAIRKAIKSFMPNFDNLRVQRKPRLQMLVDKNGEMLDVTQLSQGEKSLMALVGDIARRLAIMNPALENPLEGEGIVLIDEIDMHLHPKWQRAVIGNLNKTFPNCQFILTTHSPIVISETPNLLCYAINDGKLEKLNNLYGMDVNLVLLRDMDADIRNAQVQAAFDKLLDTIQNGKINEAKELLSELEQKVAINHIELSKARLLIRRLEVQYAKNH